MEHDASKKQPATSRELVDVGDENILSNCLLLKSKKKAAPQEALKTFRAPPSSVLHRVQAFLPQMARAESELQQKLEQNQADDIDIENVDNCDKVIEMTLALVQGDTSDESATESSDEEEGCGQQSTDSGMEEDENEAVGNPTFSRVTENNLKLPLPKRKPTIEVIEEKTPETSAGLNSTEQDSKRKDSHTLPLE